MVDADSLAAISLARCYPDMASRHRIMLDRRDEVPAA